MQCGRAAPKPYPLPSLEQNGSLMVENFKAFFVAGKTVVNLQQVDLTRKKKKLKVDLLEVFCCGSEGNGY